MTLSLTDRAADILARVHRIALPLPELASLLGVEPDALAGPLQDDRRFVLLEPVVLPELRLLPADRREAYAAALREAGVLAPAAVVLAEPPLRTDPGLETRLRDSVALLLAERPDPVLATTAERTLRALGRALNPPVMPIDRAPPSTTRSHGPSPGAPAPTRRPPPSLRRPRYPGSRRG